MLWCPGEDAAAAEVKRRDSGLTESTDVYIHRFALWRHNRCLQTNAPLPIRTTPTFPMHQCLHLKLKSLKSTTEATILKIHSDKCLWAFAVICIHTHDFKLRLRLRLSFPHQCFAACVCNVLQFSKAILTNYLLEALYSGAMPVLLFCIPVYNFLFLCAKNQRF